MKRGGNLEHEAECRQCSSGKDPFVITSRLSLMLAAPAFKGSPCSMQGEIRLDTSLHQDPSVEATQFERQWNVPSEVLRGVL